MRNNRTREHSRKIAKLVLFHEIQKANEMMA